MRRLRRPAVMAAILSTAVAASVIGGPAAQAHQTTTKPVIGGPLLAGRGIIVDPKPGAPALPTDLTSSSWMISDLTTGKVLAAKDPHGKFLPASTLKTLTAATLIPRLNPSRVFHATYKDATVDGTRAGLVPGFGYTIRKLFQCMLIMSANDAADALAQANGGIGKTLREMNAEAAYLQADDTHADTPSGLDGPGETSSAYDLALIAQNDFAIPAFRGYVQTLTTNVDAPHHKHFQISTHNWLLTYYRYPGDIGGKNGYTVAAEATYVGAATRHGQTILITLMHAYPFFWHEATSLLNWGFAALGKVKPIGVLVKPLAEPAAATGDSGPSVNALHTVGVASHHSLGSGRTGLRSGSRRAAVAALGLSLLVLLAVLVRRKARRRPRLKLPPI